MLVEQGEPVELADRLARNTTAALAAGAFGPRPRESVSPPGADYGFFVQTNRSVGGGCFPD